MNNNLNRIHLGNKNNKINNFFNLFFFISNSYNNFFLRFSKNFFSLNNILNSIFPIEIKKLNLFINYIDFKITKSLNNYYYCIENGLTYSGILKINFFLSDNFNNKYESQYVDVCEIPILTNNYTFVINGIEKTVVSKFIRSPGLYYILNNNNKKNKYLIKIIPVKGHSLFFFINFNNEIFLKILNYEISIIYILKFLGLSNLDIIDKFYEFEHIYFINKKIFLKIFYDYFLNFSIPYNITDSEGNIVVEKNTLLNENYINKIKSLNIEYVEVTEEYLINKFLGSDIILNNNIAAKCCDKIDSFILSKIKDLNIDKIKIIHFSTNSQYCVLNSIIKNNLNYFDLKDKVNDFFSKIGFSFIKKNFFNFEFDINENYIWDISNIRKKINFKLGRKYFHGPNYLNLDDIIDIIKSLILFKDGLILEDDLYSLNSLNLNLIGDFFYEIFYKFFNNLKNNFLNKNFSFKNKIKFLPKYFLNFNLLDSVIKKFFNFSKYSQFLDQINILSELAHKRRVTFLGVPGISRKHSGFDVRDLNSSQYSRLCPVETPEGINIGLVGSLSLFTLINKDKDLVSPYYKVVNCKVLNNFINYLSSLDETDFIFADSSIKILPNNSIKRTLINARCNNKLLLIDSKFVNFVNIYSYQIFSVSTSLIPFIEYNDSNRALMAANMLRQALPCLIPERPIVGTGLEYLVGINSNILRSKSNGVIKFIDPTLMIVEEIFKKNIFFFNYKFYYLNRHRSSNQNTDINQNFIKNLNDNIYYNDILTNNNCLDKSEISLGQNILVAFMSWGGYNFEDSIIVSEKVLCEERFTSLENFSIDINVYNNKEFYEILSNKFNNNLKNLDDFGIIKIGSLVSSFDLIVGKKTFYYKKKNTSLSNEIKILNSIFKKEEEEFLDSSYYLPNNFNLSEVVDVKIFFSKNVELDYYDNLILNNQVNKFLEKKKLIFKKFFFNFKRKVKKFLENKEFIKNGTIYKINSNILYKMKLKDLFSLTLNDKKYNYYFYKFSKNFKNYIKDYKIIKKNIFFKFFKSLPLGVSKLIKIYFIRKKKLQVGDKMCGRHGNKGVISKIVPTNEMPYLNNGVSIDMILNPLGVPSRMNLGQLMEVHLGFLSFLIQLKLSYYLFSNNILYLKNFLLDIFSILNYKFSLKIKDYSKNELLNLSNYFLNGFYFSIPAFNDFKDSDMNKLFNLINFDLNYTNIDFYKNNKQVYLYDGKSGEKFDNPITVGYMYILKLNHLSQDKLHSRSVGSYSLITQQPLKGKSNTGGQRFGEMEVWALEAYGASYSLRDMLTIKSDDIFNRFNSYKNIVYGNYDFKYNLPESFNVMINNINSLGIYVRFIN